VGKAGAGTFHPETTAASCSEDEARRVCIGHGFLPSQHGKENDMPVIFVEAPPGIRPEAKKAMVKKITEAVDDAYQIGDTLVFLREYPAENVAMDGKLQSENPKILEALKKIAQ